MPSWSEFIANTPDEDEAIDCARHLVAHGVPIFIAHQEVDGCGDWLPTGGTGGTGYLLPTGWEHTQPNPAVVDQWRRGNALCAVMGRTVDGLDVDPRHDGDTTVTGWASAGMYPHSYGQQNTPSGGWHDLVAPLGCGSKDNAAGGVDLKGGRPDGTGRGFLFIAPTVKLSKATGEVAAYRWTVAPDLDDLDARDDTGEWLADRIRQLRPSARTLATAPADRAEFDTLDQGEQHRIRHYLDAAVTGINTELAEAAQWPVGYRDDRGRGWQKLVSDAAYRLGALARAPWTPWALGDAWQALRDAVPAPMAVVVPPAREWAAQAHRSAPAPFPTHKVTELALDDLDVKHGVSPTALESSGARVSTWARVTLQGTIDGLLTGTLHRTVPTVAAVQGGSALFYRGKVNGLAGESGAGKTWTLLHASTACLDAGTAVVYIDHEDDQAGIVGRLLDLGANPDAIGELFAYYNPIERPTATDLQAVAAVVTELEPELVVIDSTGEGLALHGANPNADEEVAGWFLQVPRRLSSITYGDQPGPAVVVLDHVTKADDGGLWPIGSQRKRAAISGAQYMQRTVRPFSKDAAGTAILVCAKDRHGNYRSGQRVAELNVTPTPDGPIITLDATDAGPSGGEFRPTIYMERVSRVLESATEPLKYRDIELRAKGKKAMVAEALAQLVTAGHVTTSKGPHNSTLHELTKPYRDADESGGTQDTQNAPQTVVDRPRPLGRGTGGRSQTFPGGRSGDAGGRGTEAPCCSSCGGPNHPDRDAAGYPCLNCRGAA